MESEESEHCCQGCVGVVGVLAQTDFNSSVASSGGMSDLWANIMMMSLG